MKTLLGATILALRIAGAQAEQLPPPPGFDPVPGTLTRGDIVEVKKAALEASPGLLGNDVRGVAKMTAWPKANKGGYIVCAIYPTVRADEKPTIEAFSISTGPFKDIRSLFIFNDAEYDALCRTPQGTNIPLP
jgi:hypothetical protein